MITFDQAKSLVRLRLARLEQAVECELSLLEDMTEQLEEGWIFFYDSRLHQQTRDFRDALAGNGPILVDRTGNLYDLPTYVTWQQGVRLALAGELGLPKHEGA